VNGSIRKTVFACVIASCLGCSVAGAAQPLRLFIRGGKKTHGPGAHEHERFLNDWTKLLTDRGISVSGAMNFPSADDLARTDVLLLYAQDGGTVPAERRDAS
jgi:hypothetical protein